MQLNRNGFLYVIDRTNGKLLAANAFEKVNWASHVDNETGRPVETDIAKSIRAGKATEHWPSTRGGKNWPHAAFNPQTGLLYANTLHEGRMYRHLEIKPHVVGQRYQFIENLPLPPPVASIADQIWKSISGVRHFFCAVSGSMASMWPTGWSAVRGSGRFSMNW